MKNLSLRLLTCSAALCGLLTFSQTADAAGFYIQEQSVSGLGAAFAGQVSTPRDASILYFNPAGISRLDSAQVNIGVNFLYPELELKDTGTALNGANAFAPGSGPIGTDNGGNPGSLSPVPNLHIVAPITEDKKLWLGLGVAAPFGLGSKYHDDYFARFDSTESELQTIDFLPSISYAPNDRFSIGASMIIEYAHADLKRSAPALVAANTVAELDSVLKGNDWGMGFDVGVMYEPWDGTVFGANYRSNVQQNLEGQIYLQGQVNARGTAELELPDIATIGVTHEFNDRWTGLLQGTWFGWSSFDQIQPVLANGTALTPVLQDYDNSFAIAVGGEYTLNDDWVLRAGYQFDQTPTTDEYRTTLTPDGDRHWISTGATYDINDRFSLDLAATYIFIEEEDINLQRGAGATNTTTVSARTESPSVLIGAVALNYKF